MRVVTFKADDDLLRIIEEYAREAGLPKSEVIRRAVRFFILERRRRPYISRRIRVY